MSAALLALFLNACTLAEISRNVYEGARARGDTLQAVSFAQFARPSPSYEQYERERRAIAGHAQ
jgi:hypothetical protein